MLTSRDAQLNNYTPSVSTAATCLAIEQRWDVTVDDGVIAVPKKEKGNQWVCWCRRLESLAAPSGDLVNVKEATMSGICLRCR